MPISLVWATKFGPANEPPTCSSGGSSQLWQISWCARARSLSAPHGSSPTCPPDWRRRGRTRADPDLGGTTPRIGRWRDPPGGWGPATDPLQSKRAPRATAGSDPPITNTQHGSAADTAGANAHRSPARSPRKRRALLEEVGTGCLPIPEVPGPPGTDPVAARQTFDRSCY
jgi:hypothetical protein